MIDAESDEKKPRAASGSDMPLPSTHPNLYLSNAFRITGLSVDASPREVARQGERLKLMEKLGTAPTKGSGILPLDVDTDGHGLREAIQRLNDPERRLVDEFFWFWPRTLGQSKDDAALKSLSRGDGEGAVAIWLNQEKTYSESNVSMHNLAVFSHAAALDLEQLGRPLSSAERKDLDRHWKEAFARWAKLIGNEGFWSRLTARIRDLDDPRLTTGTARRIRSGLPFALLSINASLAVRLAEKGDSEGTARQISLINAAGFPESIVNEALRHAVKPIRERIKLLCANAASEGEADPVQGDKIALHLLENSHEPLSVLDRVMPKGDATLEGAHDAVAERVLLLQIAASDNSTKYQEALDLLRKGLSVAQGTALRSRIERNIEIVTSNLEYHQTYGTCWFCKTNPPDEKATIEVKMHGNVVRTSYRVTWNHNTFKVPRCVLCKYRNTSKQNLIGFTVLGAVIGFFAAIAVAVNLNSDSASSFGFCLTWISVGLLSHIITRSIITHSAKNKTFPDSINQNVKTLGLNAKKSFPPIRDRLKEGWTWGERPAQ